MAPSVFSSRPLETTTTVSRPSPSRSRSRIKTISTFLSNQFASGSATASPSSTQPGPPPQPSEPMPYHPPKAEILLPGSGASPFRVFISDGLPSTLSSIPDHGMGGISGLPGSHRGLAALLGEAEQPQWRELPTLASAIHLSHEPPTSTTFGPTQPLPMPIVKQSGQGSAIPRSSSNSSNVSKLSINKKAMKRTASRESVNQKSSLPRRMSRRLSFDSVRIFSSTSSKRNSQRGVSEESLSPEKVSPMVHKPNPLAMPNVGMRTWRSKFVVGNNKGGLLAAAKADLAARQAAKEKEKERGKGEYMGSLRGPWISPAGNTSFSERVSVEKMFEKRTLSRLPIPLLVDPAIAIASGKEIPKSSSCEVRHSLPSKEESSQLDLPGSDPTHLRLTANNVEQTPMTLTRYGMLGIPSTSRISLALSPAVDDISIVDPSHSPLHPPSPTLPLENSSSPALPPQQLSSPSRPLQHSSSPTLPLDHTSSPTRPPAAAVNDSTVNRQTSLSELKEAFTRMRDLSGVDISSITGSVPGSRSTSGEHPTVKDENDNTGSSEVDGIATIRLKSQRPSLDLEVLDKPQRPSLDLGLLDKGLKAVVDQSITAAQSTSTILALVNSKESISQSSSTSSGMMTCQTSVPAGEGELSRAHSGRSFHTAVDDPIPPLPRSRSKSTHDLASIASAKNLVEELEKTQGPGWYSTEKPRRGGRMRIVDGPISHAEEEEEEKRLAVLERLAKSSTLPTRSRFDDVPRPPSPTSPTAGLARRRPELGIEKRARPMTSMDFRPRLSTQHTRNHQSLSEWKASPRSRGITHGPRQSQIGGTAWDEQASPRRGTGIVLRRPSLLRARGEIDTITPSHHGPFISCKISPDIARRASFLNRQTQTNDAFSFSDGRHSTSSSSASPSGSRRSTIPTSEEDESSAKSTKSARTKHQLEVDTLLQALGVAKDEAQGLRDEVAVLRRLLSEGVVGIQEDRQVPASSGDAVSPTRKRSISITSTLLPTLPLSAHLDSPLDISHGCQPILTVDKDKDEYKYVHEVHQGDDDAGWELRLAEADERYLYDI
ncbi:hypothetical protein BCR39DRAFT_556152 [Naematelia encephala]|uniref:Uncharacterized protein n=1 Tax=Naematelia encephala TaxID=71784 RepID=A0A1Y2BIN4_9TREE|nr:hypothetical protein BCR39DRAFT_556152 [Naematelia encephala]